MQSGKKSKPINVKYLEEASYEIEKDFGIKDEHNAKYYKWEYTKEPSLRLSASVITADSGLIKQRKEVSIARIEYPPETSIFHVDFILGKPSSVTHEPRKLYLGVVSSKQSKTCTLKKVPDISNHL